MKVLITGSNGQLGSEIRKLSSDFPKMDFIYTDIAELDLTNINQIENLFKEFEFDVCINCAAYTAVDKAEDDKDLAMLVNAEAVENLARTCNKYNSLLIHISTDYVFSGKHYMPYVEEDKVSPDSFYGLTKLEGEKAALKNCDKTVVVRTSWLYSAFGNNFVKTMIRLGNERDEIGVVADQIGTPTHAADLARAVLKIANSYDAKYSNEIYHYSNEGAISWYDFAKAIMRIEGIDCNVKAIESKDFPAKANRPFYSVLNKAKIKNHYSVAVPYWEDSLRNMLNELKN
jgi:dTDP-4-dehydrorhamnose reductase